MADSTNWIDLTSLAVLLVFFVLGLFRGFLWQISRFASLILAWVLGDRLHDDFAGWLDRHGILEGKDYLPYLSFFVIFLTVLVLLSLLTILIEKLVRKLHMGFYDRLGGAVVGVATGTALLIACVGLVLAFPNTKLAQEVEASRTGRFTRGTVALLEAVLSPRILYLYGVPGYENVGVHAGTDGQPGSMPSSRPGAWQTPPFGDGLLPDSRPASLPGSLPGAQPNRGEGQDQTGPQDSQRHAPEGQDPPPREPVPPVDQPEAPGDPEPPAPRPRREPDRR